MKNVLLFLILCLANQLQAQTILTPEEAVAIALRNNFDIRLSANSLRQDSIDNSIGNAGMLPSLSFIGSSAVSGNQITQQLSSGSEINYNPLKNKTLNLGVELNWTIFDGGRMFIRKDILEMYESLGETSLHAAVMQLSLDVLQAYYSLVMMNEQLRRIDTLISFNQNREIIARAAYESGNTSKTNWIQAKIDLNIALSSRLKQVQSIHETRFILNKKMAVDADYQYDVNDFIASDSTFNFEDAKSQLATKNLLLRSKSQLRQIAALGLKNVKRTYQPVIQFNAGYYLNGYTNSDGSVLSSRSFGPEIGIGIKMPLYQAGQIDREVQKARIETENADIEYEKTYLEAIYDIENCKIEFESAMAALELELENFELARQYLTISAARLQQGQASVLELHQAQVEYIESSTRLVNLKMDAKLAELKLRFILSEL